MKLDPSKRNTIINFLSIVPAKRLHELADLQIEINKANVHYGLSAQVQANNEFLSAFDKIFDDMNDYYTNEINNC